MKESPHGASVVPTVAVTIAMAAPLAGHARHQHAVGRGSPVRMRQHAGSDVGQEHRRQQQQELLDAVEAAAQNQRGHDHRRSGDADVATDPEKFGAGGDPGELGAGRADVGDHERGQHGTAQPHAVPLSYQADETLPGDHTHAGRQAVEEHEGDGGQHEHPQQLVAVVRAEYRIGRDARPDRRRTARRATQDRPPPAERRE